MYINLILISQSIHGQFFSGDQAKNSALQNMMRTVSVLLPDWNT